MNRLLLVIPFLLFIGIRPVKACIDPDSLITVHVNYDTVFVAPCPYTDEIEIRLSNLRMMNESPNKICACALSSLSDLFTDLQYVAFVDSGTNNPYNGFDEFLNQSEYDDAWDNSQPGFGGWAGFISDVINGGLSASDPLEMVIRATSPPNTLILVDTFCTGPTIFDKLSESSIGTDAWDPIAEDLDQSHQEVRSLASANVTMVSSSYFTNLDNDILNNYPSDTNTCTAAFSLLSAPVPNVALSFSDESNMDGNQYVTWDFGDGSPTLNAMSATTVEHTFTSEGTFNVCISSINNGTVCNSACQDIVIESVGTLEMPQSPKGFAVYPNPASDIVNIYEGLFRTSGRVSVDLVDLQGRRVETYVLRNPRLDLSKIQSGSYFLKATIGNEAYASELIVIER